MQMKILSNLNPLKKRLTNLNLEKADFSNMYELASEECVSKDENPHYLVLADLQLKCYQVTDHVVPNNSQVKFKKKRNSNSITSNVNAVCAECGKCVCNSNHDACVSRYLKDVNARTKKPKEKFLGYCSLENESICSEFMVIGRSEFKEIHSMLISKKRRQLNIRRPLLEAPDRMGLSKAEPVHLYEAARNDAIQLTKLPLSFLGLKYLSTACYTPETINHISTHGRQMGENLDKMKEKGDPSDMGGDSYSVEGISSYQQREHA
ncbi:hypothetical protein Tco_1493701 [Tanacetum coccineum]